MKEEKPHNCRALSVPPRPTSTTLSSSFISIRISQQKIIRIKIPKLLAKTIQKRTANANANTNAKGNHTDGADDNDSKSKKRWTKPTNFFPKKVVGFMVCNVFCGGKKKPPPPPPEISSPNCPPQDYGIDSGDDDGSTVREVEVEPDVLGWVGKSLKPFEVEPTESTMPKSRSLKEILESSEDGKGKQWIINLDDEEKGSKESDKDEDDVDDDDDDERGTDLKVPWSLSSLSFIKLGKNNKHYNSSSTSGSSCVGKEVMSSSKLTGVRRSRSRGRKKVVTKRGAEEEEEEEEEEENGEKRGEEDELCKKRILMGGRCRPLNLSGELHYDKNGVLLPDEEVFPSFHVKKS